jgi:hypothetical protein
MKNILNRWLKKLYVKSAIWLAKKSNSGATPIDDNVRICGTICRKLINHPDSKFLIAPISGKRYIKNSNLGLFVILDGGKISVTNHVYHYDVVLNFKEWERLSRMYDNRTERERQTYETEITSQIEYSLSSILKKIENNEPVSPSQSR